MTASHNLPTEAINYSQPDTGTVAGDGDVVAMTIGQAATALGLKLGTLRRLVKEGCPVVRPGRDGRGNGTLLHLPTCRQWLAARQQPAQPVEALLLTLAAELPAVVAAGLDDAARLCDGPHKRDLMRLMPGVWWLVATALRDHLVELGCPEQRDLTRDDMPPALARLLNSELQSKR